MPTPIVLTHDQIDEIRARLAAATPGPWADMGGDGTFPGEVRDCGTFTLICRDPQGDSRDEDRAFIAGAPSDILNLLATVGHLIDKNTRLQKENAYLKACVPPTKPGDYGHEAWTEALREAVAAERRAVVAYLCSRGASGMTHHSDDILEYADDIERGDHLEAE